MGNTRYESVDQVGSVDEKTKSKNLLVFNNEPRVYARYLWVQ
jgi:hypothetical protein